jgi:hypothetical protein
MDAVDGEHAEDGVVQRQNGRFRGVHAGALILLAAAVALAPHAGKLFVVAYAVAAAAWLVVRTRVLPLRTVIVIALVLRGLLLFSPPKLSGDVYRYLSDGRVLAAGGNPYAYTPSDPRINHPEIRSIYPPLAQFLFALVHDLTLWRLLIVAVDIAALMLLREHAFTYATCPLVLFEGTWNGHLDAIAAVLLLVALLKRSGVAAGAAAGLKLIPIAAVPVLARSRRFIITFALTLLLPFLPFLGGPIMPGLREYATRWIFNSLVYTNVRFVLDQIPTKEIWTHHPLRFQFLSDFVYRHLYADFLTRAVLAVLAVGLILAAKRASSAVAALIICSPAIHPWYWLTVVPASLVERNTLVLAAALCAPFSYLLYDGVSPWIVFALCYALPFGLRRRESRQLALPHDER